MKFVPSSHTDYLGGGGGAIDEDLFRLIQLIEVIGSSFTGFAFRLSFHALFIASLRNLFFRFFQDDSD